MKSAKKRTRGAGSIFRKVLDYAKQPDGSSAPARRAKTWTIQFYKDGKRIREATGVTEWAEAQKLLRKRLNEVDGGKYVARRSKVRIQALYELLKGHNEVHHKNVVDLAWRWKHLGPVFGEAIAERLTTEDLNHYIGQRQAAGAANATINRELATLRHIFNIGVRYKKLAQFDTRNVFFLLKEANVRRGFVVEDEDYSRLVAEAREPWLRTFLELAYTYGWRKGELVGLRVRHVNLKQRTIRLDPGTTKNGDAREVTMTAKVEELLSMAVAGKGPEDFVLTREKSRTPIYDFRRAWRNLCTRAGVGHWVCAACKAAAKLADETKIGTRRARFERCECGERRREYRGLIVHDLRRSAAKALRWAGVSESMIMDTGGWRTTSMLHRYSIKSASDQRDAMEKLERLRAERESAKVNSPLSAPFSPSPLAETLVPNRKVQ